jgi:hypothetical protein
MKRTAWLWLVALLVTLAAARYQHVTGPTYPLSGRVQLGGGTIGYTLERSHGGPTDQPVEIAAADPVVKGLLEWKRYGTTDPLQAARMRREGGKLVGVLPHQPPAGKLLYRVRLERGTERVLVPQRQAVVTRFKGDVPPWVLVPHIVVMFAAMLLSTRTGLEAFNPQPRFKRLADWTLALLLVGGFVLGPMVLRYAFGTWWTGFPVGDDPTDNKTLAALLVWIVAAVAVRRARRPGGWVAAAAILMLVVFLIPHSIAGTELDYSKLDAAR